MRFFKISLLISVAVVTIQDTAKKKEIHELK